MLMERKYKSYRLKKMICASEADVLNMALFGMTAKQWRDKNPDKREISGIMRA